MASASQDLSKHHAFIGSELGLPVFSVFKSLLFGTLAPHQFQLCGHSGCGERGVASSPSQGLSSEVFSSLHGPCSSGPSRKPLLQKSSQLCPQRSWPLCQGHYLPHPYWNLRLGTSREAIPGPFTWSV